MKIKKICSVVIVLILVVLFFFAVFTVSRLIYLGERRAINAFAINEKNGDFAITYTFTNFGKTNNRIDVFDKYGNPKFTQYLYAKGGGVHELYFDTYDLLHAQSRNKEQTLYDENGNIAGTDQKTKDPVFSWSDWSENGNVYSKTVGDTTYYYEDIGFFDLSGDASRRVYIKTNDGTIVDIWKSEETK